MSLEANPGAQEDKLIGHWTFEKDVELKELSGHFKMKNPYRILS